MTRDIQSMPPLEPLMAKIGYVLLCWGWLEKAIDSANSALAQDDAECRDGNVPTSNFSDKLRRWRELHRRAAGDDAEYFSSVDGLCQSVTEAQVARNAICHGLDSVSVDPESGEARIKTSNRGTEIEYTASELIDLFQQIDRARLQIQRLTLVAMYKK